MAEGGAEAVSLGQRHRQAPPPTRNSMQGCSVLDVSEVVLKAGGRKLRVLAKVRGQEVGGHSLGSGGQRGEHSSGSEGGGWEDCSLGSEFRTWEPPWACSPPQAPRPSE